MDYYNSQNPQYIQPQAYRAPPSPWNKPIRRNANVVGFGLSLVLLLDIFLSPVFDELRNYSVSGLEIRSPQMLSLLENAFSLVLYLIMFIIPMTIIRLWIGIPIRAAFPMRNPRPALVLPAVLSCLGASVIGMFSASAVSTLLEAAFGMSLYRYPMPNPIGWGATIVYIFHVTVAPAIVEELVFRGVIMQPLRRFGDTFALVCSSAMFGFAHHSLEQGILAFVIGLAIGFFVLRSGSLKIGMIIHFVYNSLATAVSFLTDGLSDAAARSASMLMISVYTVAGLLGFALLHFFYSGSLKLAKSDYPVAEGRKYSLFFLSPTAVIYMLFVAILILRQFKFGGT